MNICKFKNVILDVDSGLTPEEINYFNEYLTNQYVLLVNQQYILLIDVNDETVIDKYIRYSTHPEEIESPILYSKYEDYTDYDITSNILKNEYKNYGYLNKFTPDGDITIDELKAFRKWLADTLLKYTDHDAWDNTGMFSRMLNYYSNNMYDDTVKSLSLITPYINTIYKDISYEPSCGCNYTANYYTNDYNVCDPLVQYREGVYSNMVANFSNIEYWIPLNSNIINEFKKYVDGIIKMQFAFTPATVIKNILSFEDCTCTGINDSEQQKLMAILGRLSKSLQYILDGEIDGNRNFMSNAFEDWSKYVYERMYWL